jgi:hypothetical protein
MSSIRFLITSVLVSFLLTVIGGCGSESPKPNDTKGTENKKEETPPPKPKNQMPD